MGGGIIIFKKEGKLDVGKCRLFFNECYHNNVSTPLLGRGEYLTLYDYDWLFIKVGAINCVIQGVQLDIQCE